MRVSVSFEKFSSTNRGTSGVFYKDFGDKIKAAIKDPSLVDKNLRFFVKKSGFQILNIPSLGARDVLVVPAKQQGLEDNTALDKYRRDLLHAGYKKTFEKLQSLYHAWYSKKCGRKICFSVPIIWSKFNFAYALEAKSARNVADVLNTHIFPYFGVPRILNLDNGREFVNGVISDLLKLWHSDIHASGLKTPPWSEWLPQIVYAMNTQVHDATGASPYELVFGQRARTVIFSTQQSAIVLEEDLADEGIHLGISSEVEQAIIMSTSEQISPTEEDSIKGAEDTQSSKSSTQQISLTENVVNGAEETLHADICVTESQTIQSELLEKNDESDGTEEGISRSNGNLSERIRIKADRKHLSSAKRMAERYNKQHSTYSDLSRLPCIVVNIVGGGQSLYRLSANMVF
ncbi:hypothetical protein EMCRGX_G025614 [Ephydatia muelleri]